MSDTTDNVFINCPYDPGYQQMFEALIFGVMACGFKVRSAKETEEDGQSRLEKIYEIIEQCRYGIHDISNITLDPLHQLPHFNMPFELGVWLGAHRFGHDEQKNKRTLIFSVAPEQHRKLISNLAGRDTHDHGSKPEVALESLRDWLKSTSRRKLIPPTPRLIHAYHAFTAVRDSIAEQAGFDPMRVPFFDFTNIVYDWLVPAS